MKRIFNYCTMLLVSVLAISLGSCTDEYEYIGAVAEGEQVYFSNALSSTVELNSNASSIQIPINRIQRSGALTVPLEVSVPEGSNCKVASEATFADGDSVAYINISYDPSAIEYGKYDTITIAIKDAEYTTPYGASSFTFAAGLSEWKTMSTKGSFRDGILAYMYGLDILTYQVEIQENVLTPGRYRVVSPYGEGTGFYDSYVGDGKVFTAASASNTSFIIDATDPDYVYIDGDFYTGVDDGMSSEGQGQLHVFSYVYYYLSAGNSIETIKANVPELFGKLENGVITFPSNSILANFDDSMNPMSYANSSDLTVALPGYEITDYSSSFTYEGRFTDVAGNNYAQGKITLGEDVASAKYIVAADGDDVNEIIAAVNEGLIEATQITSSTEVKVAISEGGTYNMIIMTYDAEGNMRAYSSTSFEFSLGSDAHNWQPIYTGVFTHNVEPAFITTEEGSDEYVGNPIINNITSSYSAVMYQDANDPTSFKIEPWITNETSLTFTMDSEGYITFKDVNTGFSHQTYGTLYVGDAALLFGATGQHTSGYDSSMNMFVFGTVYYVYVNGSYGWFGGAYETFEISGSQGAPANKALNGGNIAPRKFNKNAAKVNKLMSNKTMFKSATLRGYLKK